MQSNSTYFFSCDWGTSSFRLRLVKSPHTVVSEVINHNGIAVIHEQWLSENNAIDKLTYYQSYLDRAIKEIQVRYSLLSYDFPVIVSGMAASSVGMFELPYKQLPFNTNGSDIIVNTIEPSSSFPYTTYLISGICSATDVMRGEEIQLVGCIDSVKLTESEQLFILPGTHSKHITVINGIATGFVTYLTGELFQLLSSHSILSNSVEHNIDTASFPSNFSQHFEEGINRAIEGNILQHFISVRANQLFKYKNNGENAYYLSGLLIGTELKDIAYKCTVPIILIVNNSLKKLYSHALTFLGCTNLQIRDVDNCIINGHFKVYQTHHIKLF